MQPLKEVTTFQTDGSALAKPSRMGSWYPGSGVTLEIVPQRESLGGRKGRKERKRARGRKKKRKEKKRKERRKEKKRKEKRIKKRKE